MIVRVANLQLRIAGELEKYESELRSLVENLMSKEVKPEEAYENYLEELFKGMDPTQTKKVVDELIKFMYPDDEESRIFKEDTTKTVIDEQWINKFKNILKTRVPGMLKSGVASFQSEAEALQILADLSGAEIIIAASPEMKKKLEDAKDRLEEMEKEQEELIKELEELEEMEDTIKFSSKHEALQYLANITDTKVVITTQQTGETEED